jgi:3-methyladenine DNA glycosylase AlkC
LAAPLTALVLIDRLWQAGSQEERRIAAELLAVVGPNIPADSLRLVESWLSGLGDSAGAEVLASVGCAPLMRLNPGPRLEDARRWLASDNEWVRRFAALAVAALARDKGYHDPDALLETLRDAMADPSTEVRRGVVTALWEIGPKSPAELGRFLRAFAQDDNSATRWILRQTMNGLPARTQSEIGNLNRET